MFLFLISWTWFLPVWWCRLQFSITISLRHEWKWIIISALYHITICTQQAETVGRGTSIDINVPCSIFWGPVPHSDWFSPPSLSPPGFDVSGLVIICVCNALYYHFYGTWGGLSINVTCDLPMMLMNWMLTCCVHVLILGPPYWHRVRLTIQETQLSLTNRAMRLEVSQGH